VGWTNLWGEGSRKEGEWGKARKLAIAGKDAKGGGIVVRCLVQSILREGARGKSLWQQVRTGSVMKKGKSVASRINPVVTVRLQNRKKKKSRLGVRQDGQKG